MKLLPLVGWFLGATLPAIAVAESTWMTWRGSPDMRGISQQEFKFPLKSAWKVQLGKPVVATAVSDGKLVFIGDGGGKFSALDLATGTEKWHFKIKDPIEGSAGILGENVIFGAGDGLVRALRREDGKEVWKFTTEGEIKGAVNFYVDAAGVASVLVGSYDNNLYCLDAKTGAKKWVVMTSNYVNGAAALAGDKVLFGGCDGYLYMVQATDGKEAGKIEIKDNIASTVATDGKLAFIPHYGCSVLAVDLEKKAAAWTFKERDFPFVSSAAVTDDLVIAGDRGKTLWAIHKANGELKWSFRATGKLDSSPVVASNAVFVGGADGFVYAVGLADGKELWSAELGPAIQSSPCILGNRLLIGADNGMLYCFESSP